MQTTHYHASGMMHATTLPDAYLTRRVITYEQLCPTDPCTAHSRTGNDGVVKRQLQVGSQGHDTQQQKRLQARPVTSHTHSIVRDAVCGDQETMQQAGAYQSNTLFKGDNLVLPRNDGSPRALGDQSSAHRQGCCKVEDKEP
jgi:hypothetical protein